MLVERIASEIIKRAETLDGLEPIKCDCELIEFEAGWIKMRCGSLQVLERFM